MNRRILWKVTALTNSRTSGSNGGWTYSTFTLKPRWAYYSDVTSTILFSKIWKPAEFSLHFTSAHTHTGEKWHKISLEMFLLFATASVLGYYHVLSDRFDPIHPGMNTVWRSESRMHLLVATVSPTLSNNQILKKHNVKMSEYCDLSIVWWEYVEIYYCLTG